MDLRGASRGLAPPSPLGFFMYIYEKKKKIKKILIKENI